jgi:hypothetical protein
MKLGASVSCKKFMKLDRMQWLCTHNSYICIHTKLWVSHARNGIPMSFCLVSCINIQPASQALYEGDIRIVQLQ